MDITIIVAACSIIVTLYKTYKATKLDEFFYNVLLKKAPRMSKLALTPRIAYSSLKFKEFIEDDLLDGTLDNLELFDKFMKLMKSEKFKKFFNLYQQVE